MSPGAGGPATPSRPATGVPGPLARRRHGARVRPGALLSRVGPRVGLAAYAVSQLLLLGLLYIVYGLSRHLATGREVEALGNAVDVWDLERFLHLPDEAALQGAVLAYDWLLRGANWFYVGVHFPAAIVLLVWVFARHREHWRRVRNVIILATGAGLVIHLIYPLAPPRFLPRVSSGVSLVDTGAVLGPSPYGGDETGGVANQYAAMPSLHVGWAILEAWAVVTILRHRARWLVVIQPLATTAVVVLTANHYWLDGIVGGTLVAGAVLLVGRRRPAPAVAAGDPARGEAADSPEPAPLAGVPASGAPGIPAPSGPETIGRAAAMAAVGAAGDPAAGDPAAGVPPPTGEVPGVSRRG